jgi:adenylate cyclase
VIFPLRYKLALLTSALLIAGIVSVSYLLFDQSRRALKQEVAERGIVLADTLASSARNLLLEGYDVEVGRLLESIAAKPEIRAARVLDHRGKVVASSRKTEPDLRERETVTPEGVRDLAVKEMGGRLVIGSRMSFRDQDLGEAQIVMDLDYVITPMLEEARRNVLMASGALLAVGLLIAIGLSRRITRPLQRLREAVNALTAGDTSARVPVTTRDELAVLTRAFNEMSDNLDQKDRIERAFRRYVSDHVLREVVSDPASVELRGERREITVMFIDIRQFTRLTAWLGPERLVAFLNEAFELITGQLLEHGATVDKYIGDAILAYTGAPIPSTDHARRAVAAAIAVQRSVQERNRKAEASGDTYVRLQVGMGIHTGPVVVGNIGSELKMDYTAIGQPVNVASRLQGLARPGQILVTAQVQQRLQGAVQTRALGPHKLEGIDEELEIFEVLY